jgi:hypothetical protein
MPDVILNFALNSSPVAILSRAPCILRVNRFEVEQLLINLDQRLHPFEGSFVIEIVKFRLKDALDGARAATKARQTLRYTFTI